MNTKHFLINVVLLAALLLASCSSARGRWRCGMSREGNRKASWQRSWGPPNNACTQLVGVGAFSGSLHGSMLVPAKWRSLVPPTSGGMDTVEWQGS